MNSCVLFLKHYLFKFSSSVFRYGLENNDDGIPRTHANNRRNNNASGFVDLGNEYAYASGGHGASGNDEIFAESQGDKPW